MNMLVKHPPSTQRSESVTGACCLTTIMPALTLPEDPTPYASTLWRTIAATVRPFTTRLFRASHHTISDVGLIGGGQISLPGEVSRAHHGVLFLEARPACRRHGLAGMRQPLEATLSTMYRGSLA
jgi:magnesium chelatase family protein